MTIVSQKWNRTIQTILISKEKLFLNVDADSMPILVRMSLVWMLLIHSTGTLSKDMNENENEKNSEKVIMSTICCGMNAPVNRTKKRTCHWLTIDQRLAIEEPFSAEEAMPTERLDPMKDTYISIGFASSSMYGSVFVVLDAAGGVA